MDRTVSIIVPSFNQAIYLEECLNTVLMQSYEHWECLIIDDGSPDNTEEVARFFLDKDKRFQYFRKPNGGLSSARNFGIQHSKGAYILPLDADDKIHKNYLADALTILDKNEAIAVVYCKGILFGTINKNWYLPPFSPEALAKDNMVFCSGIFRRSMYDQTGGYDERLIYGKEDWDLWISIYKAGGEFYRIDKRYFYYRIKDQSMITDLRSDFEKNYYTTTIIVSKHPEFFAKYIAQQMTEPLYHKIWKDLIQLTKYGFHSIFKI